MVEYSSHSYEIEIANSRRLNTVSALRITHRVKYISQNFRQLSFVLLQFYAENEVKLPKTDGENYYSSEAHVSEPSL